MEHFVKPDTPEGGNVRMTEALEEAVEALKESVQDRFYGEVSFTIKDGEITLIRRTETIVPKTPLRGKNPYAQTNH